MLSPEDRGPAWLSDYGYTDFSQIEADIQAMEQFASKLSATVQDNYAPHLTTVTDAMATRLPDPPAEFVELFTFLTAHRDAADVAHQNVYNYANGTQDFALVAKDIGKKYSGSDAFSHAKVADVDKAFDNVASLDGTTPTTEGNG